MKKHKSYYEGYKDGQERIDNFWRMAIVHLDEKTRVSILSTLKEIEKAFNP